MDIEGDATIFENALAKGIEVFSCGSSSGLDIYVFCQVLGEVRTKVFNFFVNETNFSPGILYSLTMSSWGIVFF